MEKEGKECRGSLEEPKGRLDSVQECADACYGAASMFVFGTNEFGNAHCDSNGTQCLCLCETSATDDGTCDMSDHTGYNLYKYATPSKC